MQTNEICYIVVAAGSGSRFGGELPKQFCPLSDGRPVLMHTLDALRRGMPGAGIIVVLSESMVDFWKEMCTCHSFQSPEVAVGGPTRAHSVANALRQAAGRWRFVAIHDGARPVVSRQLLVRINEALDSGASGVVPAVAVTDSLRMVGQAGSQPVDRSCFRAVQTPQAFPFDLINAAYEAQGDKLESFTDDASLLEANGLLGVTLVEGDPANIKITRPTDMAVAQALMAL